MGKEQTSKLEKLNQEITKLSREKTEQAEHIRELNRKCAGRKGFEGRMRKIQQKLDETLIKLTACELEAVKLLEPLNVGPEMKRELAENRIHLEERAKETEKRMHTHMRKIPIPWEAYEEALKDTTEKEDLEKRLEELRKRMVFTRG